MSKVNKDDQVKMNQHLSMIHILLGNLDAWLFGTNQGVDLTHLVTHRANCRRTESNDQGSA